MFPLNVLSFLLRIVVVHLQLVHIWIFLKAGFSRYVNNSSVNSTMLAFLGHQKYDDRPQYKCSAFCLIFLYIWLASKYIFLLVKISLEINQFQTIQIFFLMKKNLKPYCFFFQQTVPYVIESPHFTYNINILIKATEIFFFKRWKWLKKNRYSKRRPYSVSVYTGKIPLYVSTAFSKS